MPSNRLLKFACPLREQGCSRRFRSQAGRTYHIRTCHTNHNVVTPPASPEPPEPVSSPLHGSNPNTPIPDDDVPCLPSPEHSPPCTGPEQPAPPHAGPKQPKKNYHPWLTGKCVFFYLYSTYPQFFCLRFPGRPCDEHGEFLPKGTPPPPRSNPGPDDWDPFEDEVQFLMGDFLFWQEEMSVGNIDILLDLWALNMAKHDDLGPFSSYEHMYSTIDSIKQGDAPWKSFTTSYAGELGPDAPSWQLEDYEVWFRDPDVVLRNMLDNPDFDGQIDYSPYIDVDKAGNRKWNEFMSGNFAWRHAVSLTIFFMFLNES